MELIPVIQSRPLIKCFLNMKGVLIFFLESAALLICSFVILNFAGYVFEKRA